MNPRKFFWVGMAAIAAVAAIVAGCKSAPPAPPAAEPLPPVAKPQPPRPAPPVAAVPGKTSTANTPRAYRRDAAGHLYGLNANRIYHGKMPPLLYAVGVLQVELDAQGRVLHTSWMRAPSHAPEVMAEIERTVRNAAPFPAPVAMGRVTYTDTWLWHKSGKFQLDTLTEGQM
ncbi:MAG: hypothetical protein Q8K38_05725 [Burkholderiaceae bacterium]|nr:hypothetical protein [Burkholderiaceae bacterium]MDZ4144418.1 hypothetical protein [Burkholderiales bacterium]